MATKKVIINPVGISEIQNIASLSIFPNPASNNLSLNVELNDFENMTIEMTDMYGKLVYTESVQGTYYRNNIDVSNLANGIYQVRIIAGENIITSNVVVGK